MNNQLVSIIIRTKDEEKWITACLDAVYRQSYKNFEVILVDNNSKDKTVEKSKRFKVKTINIDKFMPGLAINLGIRASQGDYIVCLSGHCIPTSTNWLSNLIHDLQDSSVAGIYGRQEPLSFSSDIDKRDLKMVFGMDKKIQTKDPLFHNANSAFRREIWEQFPFDENITNIEDRLWGSQVIKHGLKLIYEPEASVYHWHGIHHDLDQERASKIAKILDSIDGIREPSEYLGLDKLEVMAVIPIRGDATEIDKMLLLENTIDSALKSKYISDIVISTDSQSTASMAKRLGATQVCMRPSNLSEAYVEISDVLAFTLEDLEKKKHSPDLIVLLEEIYPFRSPELVDEMLKEIINQGLDTLISVKAETRPIWVASNSEIDIVTDGFMPRELKTTTAYIGLVGCCTVTHSSSVRSKTVFKGNIGFHLISGEIETIKLDRNSISNPNTFKHLSRLLSNYKQ